MKMFYLYNVKIEGGGGLKFFSRKDRREGLFVALQLAQ